ncbi:MAG: protein translocase subunit SecD [Gaiellaceae bacterium]
MSQRKPHLILLALILGILAAVALVGIPGSPVHKKATLGLDLQGGLEVVLQAVPTNGHKPTSSDLDHSLSIMQNRVNKLGVSEAVVVKQGTDQIVIELPGVHDPQQALQIIGKTAQLELFDLETSVTGPSLDLNGNPRPLKLYPLIEQLQAGLKPGKTDQYYVFGPSKRGGKHALLGGPSDTRKLAIASMRRLTGHGLRAGDQVLANPAGTTLVSCDLQTSRQCPGLQTLPKPGDTWYYLFKSKPALTGKDLKAGGIRADLDPNGGGAIVTLSFSGHGNKVFHAVTSAEATRGAIKGVTQHFAVVLDNQLITFPYIDYKQFPDGLNPAVTGSEISGIGSIGEAKNIALVLQTGALPVKFVPLERTEVSATLGKDSLKQAERAALIGLLLVALFLLVVYRFLGLVAVIGLAIYVAFLYGVILALNVTLTLPGFAGMILTIGVAADANIVIFERIKEEARAGKSVRAAIATGYQRGFHTILDANVVTAITATVLFVIATAGVKGFALMLLLGTGISLFTAVAGTRAMLGLLGGFRWFENPSFMGAKGAQRGRWLQIDFMRKRYLWFAISGVVLVIGAASLATRGLNLGIDFKGGTQITFETPKPINIAKVRTQAVNLTGDRNSVVQGRGKLYGAQSYKSFQLRLKSLTVAKQDKLQNDLKQQFGALKPGSQNVSASFGSQIAHDAVTAIIVSLLLIMLYIALRFDIKYALPVIIALFHDILITIGVYSIAGREVTTSTVAAVLTVLGYSIYDTIIIFDRIRENVPLMRTSPYAHIANISIWETIRRSLATTFITLLPVLALFVAGGATLKDFAFALLVGVTSGAYSSIFIAAPLLTMWKEREPEYARRKATGRVSGRELSVGAASAAVGRPEAVGKKEPVVLRPAAETLSTSIATDPGAAGKRARRQQRRRSRPHGRPR